MDMNHPDNPAAPQSRRKRGKPKLGQSVKGGNDKCRLPHASVGARPGTSVNVSAAAALTANPVVGEDNTILAVVPP